MYIGITNEWERRTIEHRNSGRLDSSSIMNILAENVTYGQSRGYEQAYIEYYKTKTGTIGEVISATNKGNKVNSFDHNSKTRAPARQKYFENAYKSKINKLKGVKCNG